LTTARADRTAIPARVREEGESALGGPGGRGRIVGAAPVGGGCIGRAARVETAAGDVVFLKWCEPGAAPAGLFAAEAQGLEALAAAGAVRVPAVLAVGETWLALEWLEPGRATGASWARLGAGLAALHRCRAGRYGWPEDNFLGLLPQANAWSAGWPAFWRERRLLPQLERACARGWLDAAVRRRFDRLLDRLDERLAGAEAEGASLLHGDLWSGNVHVLADGTPALVDPAPYHGHREVDLAMSELFGGFGREFYHAYDEAWPRAAGYADRRPIYQLYSLLAHVNLFGASYVGPTLRALAAAGA